MYEYINIVILSVFKMNKIQDVVMDIFLSSFNNSHQINLSFL